jgi:phenylpropionate dioxygenase-like ring-hydroxylating dioxygenase large terminal subunit
MDSVSYPRNAWYPAVWSQDLKPGELVPRTFLDDPVVLFRRDDGAPAAMADQCPHRFAPLHKGELLPGSVVRCLYHGLEFSSDGRCVRNPHGDGAPPRAASVRTYPVQEKHTLVWIWMGERQPDAAIPDFGVLDPGGSLATHRDSMTVAASYRLMADNLMDLSHAAFLHEGILNKKEAAWAEIKVEQRGQTLWCSRWMPNIPIARLYDLLFRSDGKPVDHWTHMRWDPPGCFLLDVGVHPPGASREQGFGLYAIHLLTPESERSTHYLFGVARKPDVSEESVRREVADLRRYAFEMQDKPMIEAQQKNIDYLEARGGARPILIASIDSGPVRMQRILDQLVAEDVAPARAQSA